LLGYLSAIRLARAAAFAVGVAVPRPPAAQRVIPSEVALFSRRAVFARRGTQSKNLSSIVLGGQ
jgi:hypothetical protein